MLLIGIVALPFVGYRALDAMFRPNAGYYLIIFGILWSPVIVRYLK